MPEVIRSRCASLAQDRPGSPTECGNRAPIHHDATTSPVGRGRVSLDQQEGPHSTHAGTASRSPDTGRTGRKSAQFRRDGRHSVEGEEKDAYYDSRAATLREFRRRASTLQEYYKENPTLLPQLPFTWRHGWRRWKLFIIVTIIIIDACVIPLVLYYALHFAGHVAGYIIFAVVASVWGGPTYAEFATRSWKLIKKEDFYRPLGSSGRWGFDITHWVLVLAIGAVTALLAAGSAPHIVFLRVLAMPAPAILYSLGGCLLIITIWSLAGWKAPFRISSTPRGGKVYPGVYYFVEDIIAVNANAGRPYREALAARYEASPRFRRMIMVQSLFWSIPPVLLAIACTAVVCVHTVPKPVAYGIGWGVPFVWAGIWVAITIPWVRKQMRDEREAWQSDQGIVLPN